MIETERLILRKPRPSDHEALFAMWADPEMMADLGPVKDAAMSEATLARHACDLLRGGEAPAVAAEHYNKPPAEAVARITGGKDALAEALAEIERLKARLQGAAAA